MCGATIFGKTYETTLNLSIVLYLHVWRKTRVKSSVETPNTKASNPISMNVRIFVKMMRTSFHAVTSEVDLDEILKTVGGRLDSQADDLDANTTRGCMTKEQQYQGNNSTKNEEDRTQAEIDELEVAHSGSKSGTPNAGVSETKEKDEIPAEISAGEPKVSSVKKNGYQSEGKQCVLCVSG